MKQRIFILALGVLAIPALAWADDCAKGCTAGCDTCQTKSTVCEPDCQPPAPICVKQRIECCHEKTTYRLVRVTEPVTRQRLVCYRDPCNPCRIKSKIITEVHNRVRYRWVCEVRPACHTRTVRVCQRPEEIRHAGAPAAATNAPAQVTRAAAVDGF